MIEIGSCRSSAVTLGIIAIITVISGLQVNKNNFISKLYILKKSSTKYPINDWLTLQAVINWNHPEMLMQQVTLVIGQVFHLYIISLPGQELINHSEKIHTVVCV